VGERWNITTELQINILNGSHEWFTDQELNVI